MILSNTKLTFLFPLILTLISCHQEKKSNVILALLAHPDEVAFGQVLAKYTHPVNSVCIVEKQPGVFHKLALAETLLRYP